MPILKPTRRSSVVRQPHRRFPLGSIDQGHRVLAVVGSLRFATNIQVRRAIFDAASTTPRQSRYRATKALRQLFDGGHLDRVQVFCPSASSDHLSLQVVNTLSSAGARALGIDPSLVRGRAPRPRSVLSHDYWLVELGVLAFAGCPPPLTTTHWWNDRVLAARKRKGQLSLPTIPDALLVARNGATGKDYPCLVELDLGTEAVTARGRMRTDFAHKIEGYLEYLGPTFRQDFGIAAPPIVLIVVNSERRLISLRETTRKAGGRGRFWFTTLERVRGNVPPNGGLDGSSAAREAPFWGSCWQTADDPGWRSLAARCEVSSAPFKLGKQ